jgi:large subunit ribosomal protein L24
MREETDTKAPYRSYTMPTPIDAVRLVVPLRDNVTGEIKDTIVEHLRSGAPFVSPEYGTNTPKHTRYIAGPENIPIPWPTGEVREFKAEAADTLRIHVDDISFSPSLLHLPLPESALDELRNKYSKTRRVHTIQYIQQKMKQDAEEQWKRGRRMVLPQQEYWERKARERVAQVKPEVTKETLDLIRHMQAVSLGVPSQRAEGPAS